MNQIFAKKKGLAVHCSVAVVTVFLLCSYALALIHIPILQCYDTQTSTHHSHHYNQVGGVV